MNGKGGGSLGTLLFSVPLAAIPLMAIFGIPQFAPVAASPEQIDPYERDPAPSVRQKNPDDPLSSNERGDLRSPVPGSSGRDPRSLSGGSSRFGSEGGTRQERPNGLASPWSSSADLYAASGASADRGGQQLDSYNRSLSERATAQATGQRYPSGTARSSTGTPTLNWQTAARRLNELGVGNYHLEPGADPLSFLFVCCFCPDESASVTMRFEAEAADPLEAVDDVLGQVEHWMRQQSAETGRVAAPSTR